MGKSSAGRCRSAGTSDNGNGISQKSQSDFKEYDGNIIMGLEFDPKEAVLHHEEGMDLIPSNKLLAGMDMSLFTVEDREKY